MRFCLLNTFFPPLHFGGDAVLMASLANLLVEAGHHVEVVHCADSFQILRRSVDPSPFPLNDKVKVHTLRSPFGTLAPLAAHCTGKDWFQAGELRRILSAGFDVTHWHNASLMGAPAAFRWGSGLRLMTLHEYWLVCPSHVLFRNGQEMCTQRTCHTCTVRRGRPPQFWRTNGLVTTGLEDIDLFFAPSEYVRGVVSNHLPDLPLQVLPNFLPNRPRLRPTREGFYLVVARLERAKGVHTIIPLFRKNGLPLKIAGAGEYAPELRRMAQDAPNIEFLGRVSFVDLPQLYARARATIIPSVCPETFGLVVLESLQQGTPVYASDYGALPGLIRQVGGGAVFRDVDELEGMLGGEQPVDLDLSAFSPEAHLRRYLDLIAAARGEQSRMAHAR